jgi:ssDNA-binding Zn-finger/Zn-ribbon topoisomerase 1
MSNTVKCPFCGEGDYDLVGLKNHLLYGGLFYPPCHKFINTLSIEEERQLRDTQKQYQKEHEIDE